MYTYTRTYEKMIKTKVINVKSPEKSKRPIPISLIICFLSVHFTFGLNFGFSKILKKNLQFQANWFAYLLSFVLTTSISIQLVYKLENKQPLSTIWLLFGFIQYSLHAVCLHFSKYNFCSFIVDMYSLDINTIGNKNKDKLIVSLIVIFFVILYAIKSVLCYMLCITLDDLCETVYVSGYWYCLLFMSLDVITLVQILIYYYVYKAAKYLTVSMENKNINKDIKWVRKQFTAVAEICDKISPTYGKLVSI